jgi:SNF2 family DNA or RNA helicase
MSLKGKIKWCISAMPKENEIDDLFPMFKFLGISGMNNYKIWQNTIPRDMSGFAILNEYFSNLGIRRKKEDVLDLKGKTVTIDTFDLLPLEKRFYNAVLAYSMRRINSFENRIDSIKRDRLFLTKAEARKMAIGDRRIATSNKRILVIISRLRRLCDCPAMILDSMPRLSGVTDLETAIDVLEGYIPEANGTDELTYKECDICLDNDATHRISPCNHNCCPSCYQTHLENASRTYAGQKKHKKSKSKKSKKRVSSSFSSSSSSSSSSVTPATESSEAYSGYSSSSESSESKHIVVRCLACHNKGSMVELKDSRLPPKRKHDFNVSDRIPLDSLNPNMYIGAKFHNLLKNIYNADGKVAQKCVVISQWTLPLDILEHCLKSHDKEQGTTTHYLRIDGSVTASQRALIIEEFQKSKKNYILMGSHAIAEGVTLHAAKTMYILDPWWNAAKDDKQAADRIYRIGQTEHVHIHHLRTEGTIEGPIEQLRKRKMDEWEAIVDKKKIMSNTSYIKEVIKLLPKEFYKDETATY